MSLEGTIHTPVGPVSKKVAVGVGIAALLVGGIVWYRQKQAPPDASAAGANTEIDPATGYAYGSAEDAAALAAQGSYVSAAGTSGGGGSSASSDTPTHASNNSEWVQQALSYLQNNDLISDPAAMSSALGKYITGSYASDNDVALINQAIAVKGMPPIAGVSGYPPAINRTPPSTGTGTGTPGTPATKLSGTLWRTTKGFKDHIEVTAGGIKGANLYLIFVNGALWSHVNSTAPSFKFTVPNLRPGTRYTIGIQPVSASGSAGYVSNGSVTTPKK
jgi:hypothetical protein